MKRMKRTRIVTGLLAFTMAAGFTACQNDSEEVAQTGEAEMVSTEVQAEGENEMESVFEIIEDEMAILSENIEGGRLKGRLEGRLNGREHKILSECATVTHDEDNMQVTIDFGAENCLGKDGLYRRGSIVITYNGLRHEPGASRTATLVDYYVNDNQLTGTKTITNATEEEGKPAFDVTVTDATYTNSRGTVSWGSNRHIEVIAGADTPRNPFDNVLSITGSTTGTNRRGVAYSFTIQEPLIKRLEAGCARTFVDGLVAYENENGLTWTLDYDPVGGQPCDRLGAININGETHTITLR